MLPDALLSYSRVAEDRIAPTWLEARDDVWLRPFLAEIEACAGMSAAELEERVRDRIVPTARRNGARSRAAEGVWHIEQRRWQKSIVAAVQPLEVRRTLFELAATMERDEALRRAAAIFGVEPSAIEAALFADRPTARRMTPPSAVDPSEVASRYNLVLAQSFLVRTTEVIAVVREHARRVVGYAKLRGLMASFEELGAPEEDGIAIAVSGPLALFHETTKYGRLLADLLPTLATTAGWSLEARVRVAGEPFRLLLDGHAPLPRIHALPRDFDSAVERRLARDLRALAKEWTLAREAAVVRVGGRLFFPDFVLVHPRGRVLVEVVGFWTREYLDEKLAALSGVTQPIVVCLDERHATEPLAALPGVVPYRDRIDAQRVVEEAERLLGRRRDTFDGVAARLGSSVVG